MSSKTPREAEGSSARGSSSTPDGGATGVGASPPSPEAIQHFCQYLRDLEVDPAADWDQFVADHAEHAADLGALLDQYERVTAILERLTPAASFSARLRQHYGEGIDPGISLSADIPNPARKGSSGSGGMRSRLSALNPDTSRYEVRQEIARGGMGAIMEVWDRELRRTLAMKVVLGGKAAPGSSESSEDVAERRLSRFLEEAQITGQLDHPGIVPVHDIGIDESARVYFTMQLIDGHDLRRVFEMARMEKGGWNQGRVISVFVRVCEAMAYAHSKNVIHRDLKPANIMVGAFGEAYVMDWGLAKVHDPIGPEQPSEEQEGESTEAESARKIHTDRSDGSTTTGSALATLDGDIVGTPAYMAPEQARGKLEEIGFHSDVYSMGAMLYHLLSGHAPYEPLGEKVPAHTILDAVRKAPPWPLRRLNPNVDSELAAICEKAMSRDAKLRYENMMALATDLQAWVEGRGVGAYTTGVLYETRKWMSRNKATTAAMGTIAFLMAVSVALFIYLQSSNFSKLEVEKEITLQAKLEAEEARVEADKSAQKATENERAMERERDRAEREAMIAQEQKKLAQEHLESATLSQTLAQRSKEEAEATAYRSSINAAAFSLRLNEVDAVRQNLLACPSNMRGWEWNHLRLAADPSLGEPIQEGEGVTDLDVARGGEVLLTYGFGLKPRLWDVSTRLSRGVDIKFPGFALGSGSFLRQLRCAVNPDASIVAVTSPTDNSLRIFNGATGDPMYEFFGARSPIVALALSEDGNLIGIGTERGKCLILQTSRGRVITEFQAHETAIFGLALSPDGSRVLTAGEDLSARVFDASTGEPLVRMEGHHTAALTAVAWSLDGQRVATSSFDGSLAIWNPDTGAMTANMHGHRGTVNDVVFSHSGKRVFSAGEDRTVRMWGAATGRQLRVFNGHDSEVRAVVRLRNEGEIASVDSGGAIRCWDRRWDASTTVIESEEIGTVRALGFDPGARYLYASTEEGALISIDGDRAIQVDVPLAVNGVDDSPARHTSFAMAANTELIALATEDGRVEIFSTISKTRVSELSGFHEDIVHLEVSDDGRRLAVAGKRRGVISIDLETGQRTSIELRTNVAAIALSPNGRWVVTAEADESVRVWDAASGKPEASHRDAHSNRITDLAISVDGALLASTSNDSSARLWTLPSLDPLGAELEEHPSTVTSVAFSPSERRLATGASDGQIRVFSLDAPEILFSILAFDDPVLDLEFSIDGSRLAASSAGGELKIWETDDNAERYNVRFGGESRPESSR